MISPAKNPDSGKPASSKKRKNEAVSKKQPSNESPVKSKEAPAAQRFVASPGCPVLGSLTHFLFLSPLSPSFGSSLLVCVVIGHSPQPKKRIPKKKGGRAPVELGKGVSLAVIEREEKAKELKSSSSSSSTSSVPSLPIVPSTQ
jgi:hypothetical protein